MNCPNCGNLIALGECYGENWCHKCYPENSRDVPSFVNIITPFDAVYQFKLVEPGVFKFNEEIDSPEMRSG